VNYLYIFLGAGVGGVLRYWFGSLIQSRAGQFPLGTLVVNITGCLVMGILAARWAGPGAPREEVRLAVLVGVLGGYTTFSSFGRETLALAGKGQWGAAGGYVLASVVLSLLAVWAGSLLGAKSTT
jgi:CrcB protein